ncbi:hypothetical protein EO50_28725 [Salmonella enterica]|nr:hypothetical protein [Salmonella enterica]
MVRITDNKKDACGVWCRLYQLRAANPGTRFMRCGVNVTQAVISAQAFFYCRAGGVTGRDGKTGKQVSQRARTLPHQQHH